MTLRDGHIYYMRDGLFGCRDDTYWMQSSTSIPINQVKIKFIDMYSNKENQYFISQSQYAQFTACQYLNYIINKNKNELAQV